MNEKEKLLVELSDLRSRINELEKNDIRLKKTDEELKAANQQLDASNQQLAAGEQQPSTINQQLQANELELRKKETIAQEAREYAESIIATVREPIVILDHDLCAITANRFFCSTFKVTHQETEGKIQISGERENGFAKYVVEDNGIGIHPKYQEKVFELFHKLDPQKPGIGLGMNIVKQIVQSHGGRIELESVVNVGTKFSIFIST